MSRCSEGTNRCRVEEGGWCWQCGLEHAQAGAGKRFLEIRENMYSRVWHEKAALEVQSLHFSDVVGVMALKPASKGDSFS